MLSRLIGKARESYLEEGLPVIFFHKEEDYSKFVIYNGEIFVGFKIKTNKRYFKHEVEEDREKLRDILSTNIFYILDKRTENELKKFFKEEEIL